MSKNERTEELAVVTSAAFGSDRDRDGACTLRLGLRLLGGGCSLTLEAPDYIAALKTWRCSDISTLQGRACAVSTTGLAGDIAKWARALR